MLLPLMLAAASTSAPAAVQLITEGQQIVMRSAGEAKPLYTFDKDTPGQSNCNDRCATAWPPLVAPKGAVPVGDWTVVTRADGSPQWAHKGKPVYLFARDTGSQATGDGMGGVWHLLPTHPAK